MNSGEPGQTGPGSHLATCRGKTVGVRIAGTGMSVPEKVLTNEELARIVDTSDEWISKRTGIKTRHMVEGSTTTRDLARKALRDALQAAELEASQLDQILLATLTPTMTCPSTAVQLAHEVGAAPAAGLDLSAACSGFVYALNLATGLIESGRYRHVAVIGAETLSKITDWTDRRSCVLFGDGAGAAILSASDDPNQGCIYQSMHSDGALWGELYLPREEKDLPKSQENFTGQFNTLQMNGREVYKFAVAKTQKMIDDALQKTGINPNQLAMIIPHQSNKRILESAREKLGLPPEKLYINIDRFGNTSAASVPLCLHELLVADRLKKGDLVLFLAIGGGMTWASNLWRI